jgi:adenylate cyclase
VVAEIELDSEDEQFDIPEWVLEEVTPDPRYYNMNLTVNPFSQWKEK